MLLYYYIIKKKSMFSEIKNIKNKFLNNLNNTENFSISKDILLNFKNIVNYKSFLTSAFLISLSSNTVLAVELDKEALKSKLLSQSIEHVDYKNNNFITITENNINSFKRLDKIIIQNPFLPKVVVSITKNEKDLTNRPKYFSENKGSRYLLNKENDINIIKNIDHFKHLVFIDENQIKSFENVFKIENKNHVYPLFLLHELAHGSFEQGSYSSLNDSKFGQIQSEIHSDVASILMYLKISNLNKKESISLIDDLINFRLNNTIYLNDWKHDSTFALLEVKNQINENIIKFNELNKTDISAYSSQITREVYKKNYSKEFKNILDNERIKYNQSDIYITLVEVKEKINKKYMLTREEKFFYEMSKILTKKDISKIDNNDISEISVKLNNQFDNISLNFVNYFSKYYQDSLKEHLKINKKNSLISLNL